jgi:hypothetical protein
MGKLARIIALAFAALLLIIVFVPVHADSATSEPSIGSSRSEQQVIQSFTSRDEVEVGENRKISDQRKQQIMFFLGVPLLLLIIATVSLGIAMGVYGKQVYIAHMVCAGLSLTLALAHAVVGIVWFYPF